MLLLLSRAEAQRSCEIRDLISSGSVSFYAPGCSRTTVHGGMCDTSEEACRDEFTLMRNYTCVDGSWRWLPQSQVCDAWRGCVYHYPERLQCEGVAAGQPYPAQFPDALDERLTHITAVNMGLSDISDMSLSLPVLEYLNISHNRLPKLRPSGLQIPSLRTLDVSFNALTEVVASSLPVYGNLQRLYLQGNPIQKYSEGAFFSAISDCRDFGLDVDLDFNAPHCSLKSSLGVEGNSSSVKMCKSPICSSEYQPAPVLACEERSSVGRNSYAPRQRCDGRVLCVDGSDERGCSGTLSLLSATGDGGLCTDFTSVFSSTYSISSGLVSIPLTDTGQNTLGFRTFTFPERPGTEPIDLLGGPSKLVNSARPRAVLANGKFVIDINYTVALSLDDFYCRLEYKALGDDSAQLTTAAAITSSPDASQTTRRGLGAGVVAAIGVVCGVLCACTILVLWYRRRWVKLNARAHLNKLAPLTPRHLLSAVCKAQGESVGSFYLPTCRPLFSRALSLDALGLQPRFLSLILFYLPPHPVFLCRPTSGTWCNIQTSFAARASRTSRCCSA